MQEARRPNRGPRCRVILNAAAPPSGPAWFAGSPLGQQLEVIGQEQWCFGSALASKIPRLPLRAVDTPVGQRSGPSTCGLECEDRSNAGRVAKELRVIAERDARAGVVFFGKEAGWTSGPQCTIKGALGLVHTPSHC